jgi:hypothetical protein
VVKTPPSHGGNGSSNLPRVTIPENRRSQTAPVFSIIFSYIGHLYGVLTVRRVLVLDRGVNI